MNKWLKQENKIQRRKQISNNNQFMTGIAQETAEPNIKDEENIQDSLFIPPPSTSTSTSTSTSSTSTSTVQHEKTMGQYQQPTGTVVGIVRRNFRQNYCGSIYTLNINLKTKTTHNNNINNSTSSTTTTNQSTGTDEMDDNISSHIPIIEKCESEHSDGSSTCVFFAVDSRIPPILIRTTQKDRLLGKRILVVIDSWPVDSPYPLGHYVKTLGISGVKDVETEVLLHEHDIPCDPFPAKVSLIVIDILTSFVSFRSHFVLIPFRFVVIHIPICLYLYLYLFRSLHVYHHPISKSQWIIVQEDLIYDIYQY